MTLLSFLLALGVLITVHEWGHYRVAVACGVKVMTFSIGFGQPLFRWKSRRPHAGQDTEFLICLIPLGGYVKMLDENEIVVAPVDAPMAFNRQPLWARAAIVSAGPLANLLLAGCLYAATFFIGQYETRATLAAPIAGSMAETAGLRSGDTVIRVGHAADELQPIDSLDQLRWWLLEHDSAPFYLEVQSQDHHSSRLLNFPDLENDSSDSQDGWQVRGFTVAWSRAVLGEIQHGLPAQVAGLQRGDEVLRVDGRLVEDANSLRGMVRASGAQQVPGPQTWEIVRNGHVLSIEVIPDRIAEGQRQIGRIGAQVGAPPSKIWVQYDLFSSLGKGLVQTWEVTVMTLDMLGRLVSGKASLDNLSGPLTMADYAGRSASLGLGAYLSYLALVSVSLGVFNLLPLPVLDGGHLLYYLYEACTGQPPSRQWLDLMQRAGLAALVALMVFSLFNDVIRLGWLT